MQSSRAALFPVHLARGGDKDSVSESSASEKPSTQASARHSQRRVKRTYDHGQWSCRGSPPVFLSFTPSLIRSSISALYTKTPAHLHMTREPSHNTSNMVHARVSEGNDRLTSPAAT